VAAFFAVRRLAPVSSGQGEWQDTPITQKARIDDAGLSRQRVRGTDQAVSMYSAPSGSRST
jgi:hypothetical protein